MRRRGQHIEVVEIRQYIIERRSNAAGQRAAGQRSERSDVRLKHSGNIEANRKNC
jgi:hypothetical protein